MTRDLVLLVLAVYAYFIMRKITGIKFTEILLEFVSWALSFLNVQSRVQYKKAKIEFGRMSVAQKRKSKKYIYHTFIDGLLISLKMKQFGVTVEGLSIVVGLITVVIVTAASLVLRNIFMFIVLYAVVYVALLAFLYLVSRVGAQEYKHACLQTLDMLCATMSDGITASIEGNINAIPVSIRQPFRDYLLAVKHLNVDVVTALNALNSKLDVSFDEFCATAIDFEQARAPGQEELFSFIIKDNAKAVIRDKKIMRSTDKVTKDFFGTTLLLVLMFVYMASSYDYVAEIYATPFGQLVLIGVVLLGLCTFIFTQYLLAKPFIYKEK